MKKRKLSLWLTLGCRKLHIEENHSPLKVVHRAEKPVQKVEQAFFFSPEKTRAGEYRYGFNGMEKDDEVSGNGNSYSTHFRQYDPRLGRWFSLDPLMEKYPNLSPYNYVANNPLVFVDRKGDELYVFGSEADWNKFKALVESEFAGLVELKRDENNVVTMGLSQEAIDIGKESSVAYFATLLILGSDPLHSILSETMLSEDNTRIRLAERDNAGNRIDIGSFRMGLVSGAEQGVNIGSIIELGNDEVYSSKAALIHELTEAFDDQVTKQQTNNDLDYNEAYMSSHDVALEAQAEAMGYDRALNVRSKINTDGSYTSYNIGVVYIDGDPNKLKHLDITVVERDGEGKITSSKTYLGATSIDTVTGTIIGGTEVKTD